MNISALDLLSKLLSSNPNEAKALIKLVNIEVLKSLGDANYTLLLDGKTLNAKSDKVLQEGAKYWANLSQQKATTPQLSSLVKQPVLLKNIAPFATYYSLKDIQTLLVSKEGLNNYKHSLLEQLSNATSKDEFSNISALLLSLHHQVATIALNYSGIFSILQFKKRYNKKTKKVVLDFYAALEILGPISGIVALSESEVIIELSVAFEKTKQFLEENMNGISYDVKISLLDNIEPLFVPKESSLLDISI